ncbi:hypothetical protein L249_1951, partial [Ophiocordyceps polyrhachis-furcata BCC 54312]
RDIPYDDYARAALPLNLLPAIRNSLIPAAKQYSIPKYFLKSCNLYLARRLFTLRSARDLISAPRYPYS